MSYFPLRWETGSPFMQDYMKITYFYNNLFKFQCCNNLWIFYLLDNYPLIFYKVQISINLEEIIHTSILLSFARPDNSLPNVREITHVKKV